MIPKLVDPPAPGPPAPPLPLLGTFGNKNVTFGQKSRVFKAKNYGHQNFKSSLRISLLFRKYSQKLPIFFVCFP